MSSLSHSCTVGLDCGVFTSLIKTIKNALDGFFRSREITKIAKIYHGDFEYDLVPDTAIKNFNNMKKVTSVDAGSLYIYIFEYANYKGQYQILGPGEKAQVGICGSLVVGMRPVSIDEIQKSRRSLAGFWELAGPMYIMHFSSGYRYS